MKEAALNLLWWSVCFDMWAHPSIALGFTGPSRSVLTSCKRWLEGLGRDVSLFFFRVLLLILHVSHADKVSEKFTPQSEIFFTLAITCPLR